MELERVLHMKEGGGQFSYANNSSYQKNVILKVKPSIQESIAEIVCSQKNLPNCLKFADLGCSSGPNAFVATWEVIQALHSTCSRLNLKPPMLQVFLNDLPGNDFNTTFKWLPSFYERLKKEKGSLEDDHDDGDEVGQCFITAVPGTFYKRLFPSESLHFVFSSYSLHWLSQVPKGLMSQNGTLLNKTNIYIEKTSPPEIHRAYLDQFESDFTTFLQLRSEELKPGGCMVLTLISHDKDNPVVWDLIGMVIHDMVSEGLIEASKLESFNIPMYSPCIEEVRSIVEREGSFHIHQLHTFHLSLAEGFHDNTNSSLEEYHSSVGKSLASIYRSLFEPLLVDHFGNSIDLDDVFNRTAIRFTQHLQMGFGGTANLLIALIKK